MSNYKSQDFGDVRLGRLLGERTLILTDLQTIELLPSTTSVQDDDVDTPAPTSSKDASIEPTKIAISNRRRDALIASLVQIVPLSVTIPVLCLSLYNVYWDDLGSPHQEMILQGWQFAAKGHEILIVASLSALVLHKIRYELCVSDGVPLGLVAAGYQLSSVAYLWSFEFWGGITSRPVSARVSQWPPLWFVIGFAVFLSAVAGPSSAIAMIPRLNWWDVPEQFFNTPDHKPNSYYLQGGPSMFWPEHLTVDMIPPGCLDHTVADPAGCPYQGFDNVMAWTVRRQDQELQPNISIENYNTIRYLTSSANRYLNSSWTATSSVSIRDARDLGNYWEYVLSWGVDIAKINRPTMIPFIADSPGFQKPLVQVQCAAYYDAQSLDEIVFPHDHLNSWPLQTYSNTTWAMPVNFSADVRDSSSQNPLFNIEFQDYSIQDEIFFEWIDMTNFTEGLTLGALAVFWTGNGSTAVVPCTIDAHWVPVSIFLDPRYDGIIFQDSPDPGLLLSHGTVDTSTSATTLKRISVDKDWADTMNYSHNGTNFNSTLYSTAIEALISGFGSNFDGDHYKIVGDGTPGTTPDQNTIPWRISTMLGMYLTEGLASIQLNSTLVYHDYKNDTYVLDMGNLDNGHYLYPGSPNVDFEDYASTQGFTKVQIRVQRYGYGWSFQGVPIKLAATVLGIQSAMAIVQAVMILTGRWTCASWTSMGQMLVLALSSLPPKALRNTSAGVRSITTWKRVCAINEVIEDEKTHLQLVISGEGDLGDDHGVTKPGNLTKYA